MFTQWLKKITKQYDFNVIHKKGDSHFVADIYNFSDSNEHGLSFSISINDEGLPSVFNTDLFQFKYFNVAEGAESRDILMAAEQCLNGDLKLRKGLFGASRIIFQFPSFKGFSSRARVDADQVSGSYRKMIPQ